MRAGQQQTLIGTGVPTGRILREVRVLRIMLSILFFALALGSAQTAWAVQSHGGAEGLVAHQIGHVLFACGLVAVYRVGRKARWSGPAWSSFRWFLFLSLAWCILTFTGHLLDEWVDSAQFVRSGAQMRHYQASTVADWFYYLSRLDHLLWVPALSALLRALVFWERSVKATP